MDRRVLGTIAACLLFSLIFFWIMPKPERPPGPAGSPPANASGVDRETGSAAADAGGPDEAALPTGDFAATDVATATIEPYESDELLVLLTNRGAALEQVYLKQYFRTVADRQAADSGPDGWVALFPEDSSKWAGAPPLSLREVKRSGEAGHGLERVNWEVERDEPADGGRRTIVFRHQSGDGLIVRKTFAFAPGYTIDVTVGVSTKPEARGDERLTLKLSAAPGIKDVERGQWTIEPTAVAERINRYSETEVEHLTASALHGDPVDMAGGQGTWKVAWGGCSNLYFAALLAPKNQDDVSAVALHAGDAERVESVAADLIVPIPVPRDGQEREVALTYFVGPKDPDLLKSSGLEAFIPLIEVDYGSLESFRWINKLLLSGLRFFHGLFGNWGLAIIVLTLILRVCIFPITRTQQVSMQRYSTKMQALKPKLDELRERFKNNTQKFAQEQMKLLREHGARPPVVGCLSSLITIPVFIAMFQILRSAIELRQAPFVGWIHDLSLPDALVRIPGIDIALNVLPILATGAFFGQMLMAPKPADPQAQQQQKIMLIMPFVFGVMFYNYAAGLSLYMLTSSAYGMFEYRFIRKRFFPTTPAVAVPAVAKK